MSAITFEEAAEVERLLVELGRFNPDGAADQGFESLGYSDENGSFLGRRVA
ncbi:hypothetical protein ACFYY2_07390 [Streptomyces sp. NPDC001822]|uniref:hypothetical protein n=1 Tax=Streptomyces sp. NPDC001822 TaxID=3364614 RepID=UPI0036A11D32